MDTSLRIAALLFGDFTGFLEFPIAGLLLGTQSRLYCHSTIQFTWLYLHAGTTGEAPSKLSTFTEQEQQMKELEDLTIQLQSITYENTELGELLDNCHYKDLNNR